MRTLFNKSLTPLTKSTPEEALEEYRQKIEDAKKVLEAAEEAKETAEVAEDFRKACDDVNHAKETIIFYEKKITEIKYTPRMSEEEYQGIIDAETEKVDAAAAEFRKIASKCMDSIAEAYTKYKNACLESDQTLETLDLESNVLQSKYRYHEQKRFNAPSIFTEDPGEWRQHTTRFWKNGGGHNRITLIDETRNEKLFLAARAGERLTK